MMCMFLKFRPWIFSLSVVLVCGCHMESEHDQDGEPGYLEDEMMCPRSGDNFLEQRQIPWGMPRRAWKTIPEAVEVRKSKIAEAGLGVIATKFIPAGSWLAEYEGLIRKSSEEDDTSYTWSMTKNNTEIYDIDGGHLATSNWLRWINCARTPQEENVESCLCYGKIYYRALKDIAPSEEMLVYYGDEYAELLGIDIENFTEIDEKLEYIIGNDNS